MSEEMSSAEAPLAAEPAAAADTLPSAGTLLRQMREAADVHAAVLASAMKVPLQKLEALEADRLDLLPDVTFARGLAAAICRAFGADPAPVLARMPVAAPGLQTPRAAPLNQSFRRTGDRPAPLLARSVSWPLLIAVGLLLLGAALLWLLPTLPIQLGMPASADSVTAADAAPRDSARPSPAAEPAPPAELPSGAASAEQVAPAPAASEPAAPSADGLLVFTATGETWLTVRDAAGKSLVNRALASGETLALTGDVPLSVTVGRKDAIQLKVRGQPFDVMATSRTNVARFQIK